MCSHTSFRITTEQAQEQASTSPSAPNETNVSERVRLLEAELERQNAKLDQQNAKLDELQKTIAKQQSAMKALLEKLSENSPPLSATPLLYP